MVVAGETRNWTSPGRLAQCGVRRADVGLLDQRGIRGNDEPDSAGTLPICLTSGGVAGEVVQRPLSGLQLLGSVRPIDDRERCGGGQGAEVE